MALQACTIEYKAVLRSTGVNTPSCRFRGLYGFVWSCVPSCCVSGNGSMSCKALKSILKPFCRSAYRNTYKPFPCLYGDCGVSGCMFKCSEPVCRSCSGLYWLPCFGLSIIGNTVPCWAAGLLVFGRSVRRLALSGLLVWSGMLWHCDALNFRFGLHWSCVRLP